MWAAANPFHRVIVFLIERLITHDGPTRGLDDLNIEAVLRIEAHWMRHDNGRCAGDRDEADLQFLFLEGASSLREQFGRRFEREELAKRRHCGGGPNRFEEGATRGIVGKYSTDDCCNHGMLVALLLAVHAYAVA